MVKKFFDEEGKTVYIAPVEIKPGQEVALCDADLDKLTRWSKIEWDWGTEFTALRRGTAVCYLLRDSEGEHLRRVPLDIRVNIDEGDTIVMEFTAEGERQG